MRFLHPGQRFVGPQGAPPKAPGGVRMRFPHPGQRFVAHRELHRRPQWEWAHALPPPRAAFRGPIGSFTEGPSG
eukprot:3651620-Pyramimonas_sp.AAC.1